MQNHSINLYSSHNKMLSGNAYRAVSMLMCFVLCSVFLMSTSGLVYLNLSNAWMIVNITLLGLGLCASSLPTNMVLLSQAYEADSVYFIVKYLLAQHGSCFSIHCHHNTPSDTSTSDSNRETVSNINRQKVKVFFQYFLVLFSLFFLLQLCGDVELNPGPLMKMSLSLTVRNVAEKLCSIDNPEKLKKLGVWLNVPRSERSSLLRLLTYFMEKHPFGSWRTVIWSLDAIEEPTVADEIRNYAEEVLDDTLTVENVTRVMMCVSKGWYGALADAMAVPWVIQDRVKEAHKHSDSEQTRAVVKYWVTTLHDASWSTLAGVLYEREEGSALQEALVYCKHSHVTDPTLTHDTLMNILGSVVDDIDSFAYYLDMRISTRDTLKKEHKDEVKKEEEKQQPLSTETYDRLQKLWLSSLFKEWLEHHPAPTWRLVVNALSWMGRKNCKLHRVLENIYKSSNFFPDPENQRMCCVLDKAMSDDGVLQQSIVQLHLSGTARSGKTSLIRRLMGKKARKMEPSTGVADKAVRVDIDKSAIVVDTVENSRVWREIKTTSQESTLLLTGMRENMSETGKFVTDHELTIIPSTDSEHRPYELQPEANSLDSSVNPVKVFVEAIHEADDEIRRIQDPLSIYITDIGGQHEFQELIPTLVSGPSIFLIVIPAHWGLENTFPVNYVHQNGTTSSYKGSMTLKEHVLQTIATIMCVGEQKEEGSSSFPKILFVLTFKDKVSSEELAAVESELLDAVKPTKALKSGMIKYQSEGRLCHSINNLSDDDEDVWTIRKTIERVSKKTECTIKTPFSWQIFGTTLRSLPYDVVSYNNCLEVAKRCNITSRDEMNKALVHFHENTGVLRYYQSVDKLQVKIILNPQVLFDMVTDLVSLFTFQQVGKIESENFFERGIFSSKTIAKIQGKHFTAEEVVAFLKHHHIVAPLERDRFLLPCILAKTEVKRRPSSPPNIVPLLFLCKDGFIPRGLFGFMITHLLENNTFMGCKLEMLDESERIFYNEVSFCINPFGDEVVFSLHPTFIRIDVVPSGLERSVSDNFLCICVKNLVTLVLNQIKPYGHNVYLEHEFAFLCPCDKEIDHPAVVTMFKGRPEKVQCTLTSGKSKYKNFAKENAVWFDESRNSEPTIAQLQLFTTNRQDNIKIIARIAPKWKDVCTALDFDNTGSQLALICTQYGHTNPVECCKAVFMHWLEGNGRRQPCTWEIVCELLEEIEYIHLAEELKFALLSEV